MTDRPRAGEEEENSAGGNNRPDETTSAGGSGLNQDGAADNTGRSGISPGQMLRRAREANQLSLDEMVVQTKLSRSILEAMENDNFSALAEPVFARGYYRRCARVLEMPEDELLQAYEQASGEPPPRPVPPGGVGEDEPLYPSRNWLPMVLLVVLGCLMVAAIIWWTGQPKRTNTLPAGNAAPTEQNQNSSSSSEAGSGAEQANLGVSPSVSPSSSGQTGNGQPAPAGNGGSGGGSSASSAASPTVNQEAGSASSNSPQQSQQAAGQTPAASQSQPSRAQSPSSAQDQPSKGQSGNATGGAGVLHLSFNHKCWVSVHDATGKALMNGMAKAGTSRDLKGTPPYRIVLGYAPGVQMTYNGKPVNLKAHTNGNAIAHVTVGHS